jgi:hypothetical protein
MVALQTVRHLAHALQLPNATYTRKPSAKISEVEATLATLLWILKCREAFEKYAPSSKAIFTYHSFNL